MPCRAILHARSSPTSAAIAPLLPYRCWLDLLGRVQGSDAITIEIHLLAAVHCRQAGTYIAANRRCNLTSVIFDQRIRESHSNALRATMDGPDESPVGSIELVYARLLFDDLRSVETE